MNDQLAQEWLDRIAQDHADFQVTAGKIEALLESTYDPDAGYKRLLAKLFNLTGVPEYE